MKLIRQEEAYGCGIACVAMILGKTYAEVRNDFLNDFEKKGMPHSKFIDYLGDHGYSVIKKEIVFWPSTDFTHEELLKPFAPLHLVNVQPQYDAANRHSIVMDAKGKLFCPAGQSEESIRKVYMVHQTAGLWK